MFRATALPRAVAPAVPITLGAWTAQAAGIIETAKQDGRFDGFVYLLEAADMVERLQREGPFTVFAPADEALGQLPPEGLEWPFADESREPLEVVIPSHIFISIEGARRRDRQLRQARDERARRRGQSPGAAPATAAPGPLGVRVARRAG